MSMTPEQFAAYVKLFELKPVTPGDIKAAKRYDWNYDWGYGEARDDANRGITRSLLIPSSKRRPGYQDGYTDGYVAAMREKLADAQRGRDEA